MKPRSSGRLWRSSNPAFLPAVFVLFAGLGCSYADEVDDYVNRQMRRQHVAGLSLAVVKNGKLIRAKGYGLANVELKVQATPETVYNIASIGKQFTATAIMLLVDEGEMGLDDKITNHLSGLPPAWSPVTVRQLLTHTSGIKDYPALPDFRKLTRSPVTTSELVQMLADYGDGRRVSSGGVPRSKRVENDPIRKRITRENSRNLASVDMAAPETGALRYLGNTPSRCAHPGQSVIRGPVRFCGF